jgi:hypothetical protein
MDSALFMRNKLKFGSGELDVGGSRALEPDHWLLRLLKQGELAVANRHGMCHPEKLVELLSTSTGE